MICSDLPKEIRLRTALAARTLAGLIELREHRREKSPGRGKSPRAVIVERLTARRRLQILEVMQGIPKSVHNSGREHWIELTDASEYMRHDSFQRRHICAESMNFFVVIHYEVRRDLAR